MQQVEDDIDSLKSAYKLIFGSTLNYFAYTGTEENLKQKLLEAIKANKPLKDSDLSIGDLPNGALF